MGKILGLYTNVGLAHRVKSKVNKKMGAIHLTNKFAGILALAINNISQSKGEDFCD